MRQPKFLTKGDTIAFVAPSFGVTTEPYATRFDEANKNFQRWGFLTKIGPNVKKEEGVVASASAEERAKEIMDAFADEETGLILSVGGGELMCEILPYVDFSRIKNLPPKWFMGFSDNTNLVFPLVTLADTMAIYGSCAPSFYARKPRLCEEDALKMLQGEQHFQGYPKYSITRSNPLHPLWQYRLTQPKIIVPSQYEKPFEGIMLGGCLDCLSLLVGTRYDRVKEFIAAHPEGVIWFLEACDFGTLSLRRALWALREAGWFDNASGFLIGRPLRAYRPEFDLDKFKATLDILEPLGKPILMDVDLGHVAPSMPIKAGAHAKVTYDGSNLFIDYAE